MVLVVITSPYYELLYCDVIRTTQYGCSKIAVMTSATWFYGGQWRSELSGETYNRVSR